MTTACLATLAVYYVGRVAERRSGIGIVCQIPNQVDFRAATDPRSPNQVDLPGRNGRTRKSAGTTTRRQGQLRSGQGFGPAGGNFGSASGAAASQAWPEAQADARPSWRVGAKAMDRETVFPTRVQGRAGPSHNVPSRTCAATRCQRGRPRRGEPLRTATGVTTGTGGATGANGLVGAWAEWPMPQWSADVTAGAPNPEGYTDNGDGTVTDNVTGSCGSKPSRRSGTLKPGTMRLPTASR